MKVLAIDTACSACSVAVVEDGMVLGARSDAMVRGHAEALMPMVQQVMAAAESAFADLDLIAVTIGPGSFTGMRTGLAAARGVGLAQGIAVAGVTTLEAVAVAAARVPASLQRRLPILVALETRRADLYIQRFDAALVAETDALALPPEQARVHLPATGVLLAGEGAERLLDGAAETLCATVTIVDTARIPDIADVAAIAAARVGTPLPAHPLYIHPPAVRRPVSAPVSAPASAPVTPAEDAVR